MADLSTPILFIIFNRPEQTKKVFAALKKIKPNKLYIAADGPRTGNIEDLEKCKLARSVIDLIDWPCQINTLFQDKNLGCGHGPAQAISWLFENEEQGIILEDDCLPDSSFFFFCEELLEKYRYDTRIMHIAGTNHNPSFIRDKDYSYFFSQVGHIWGWATWKRAWNLYDITMNHFQEIYRKDYFKDLYPNYLIRKYLVRKFTETYAQKTLDVWDYQWEFTRLINAGITIMPQNNLVHNIGFGADATHTFSNKNHFTDATVHQLEFPLKHPPFIVIDWKSESMHFNKMFRWIVKRKLLSLFGFKGYDFKG
jgi:hypothetical protein